MKAPNERHASVLRIRNCATRAHFKYNIFRCRRSTARQIDHDGLEDSASDPSTGSLALRARGRFRWSRARRGAGCWEGFRCSRRTLPYCRCSHGLVWRDGPRPHCLSPFTSEPWFFFPAAGPLRRARGDSCALSCPVPDILCIAGAYSVLAQCLATEDGGGAAGERTTLAKPYRSAAAVGVGRPPDGGCHYFSTQWTNYTGVGESDLLGWRWMDALHPDDREATRQFWTESVAGRHPYDVEY